ncbi:hypothetical protein ACFLVZ_00085 [Chloroflexota bacterium]
MLKPGRKIIIYIGIGVLIIILGSLGMVLFQSLDEKSLLTEQLTVAQSQLKLIDLEKLSSQRTEMESKVREAESQLGLVKRIISEPVGSISAATAIFEIAKAYGLTVTEITSPGPEDEELEGTLLEVVSLTAQVNGNITDLVNFTTDLNSYFSTGAVKTVTITVPEGSSEDNATASVQLVVYTYRGD